jgi:hypothetical protein
MRLGRVMAALVKNSKRFRKDPKAKMDHVA